MKKISLEEDFEAYLKMVRLAKEDLTTEQYTELKRAFYGAAGMLMVKCSKIIFDKMNEEESQMAMLNLLSQIGRFWAGENDFTQN